MPPDVRAAVIEECAKIAETKFAGTLTSNIGKLIADDIRDLALSRPHHSTQENKS
jgi:hypothetical protein